MRESVELSIADLSLETNIQKKHLEWLEEERFDLLPPPVYVRGFVARWAQACGADVEHLLLQFDRVQAFLLRDKHKDRSWLPSNRSFILTGRMLTVFGVAAVVLSGAFYVGAQYLHIGGAPMVNIDSPASLEVIVSDQWIVIQGSTENIKRLTVAGQEIDISPDGSFSKQVALQAGVNVVRIEGEGKNGESIEVMRKVVQVGSVGSFVDPDQSDVIEITVDPAPNSPSN